MRSLVFSLTVAAGLLAGIATSNVGCGAADAAFDCHQVCQRYKDCYSPGYDVGKCADRCRTASANDTSYRAKADQCEACIGPRSCISATFACGLDCGAIVPGDQ